MRRTTLRGWENLNKRFKLAAAFYNLSQLMRQLFGFGTPKQLAAAMERGGRGLFWRSAAMTIQLAAVVDGITSTWHCARRERREVSRAGRKSSLLENRAISTGC